MDQNEFQENHLLATMKCLEEFEKLTQNYQDLNMDYENLLVNDLKGLHSNYCLINYDKKSPSISEMIYSIIQKRFDFSIKEKNVKQNHKNKALSFFNLILLLSFFIIDFSFKIATFFYKLIFNFDFNYKFIIELVTSTFKSSANNAAMIFYDWRLFFCIDTILKKILW